jgi:hypothetical protein
MMELIRRLQSEAGGDVGVPVAEVVADCTKDGIVSSSGE